MVSLSKKIFLLFPALLFVLSSFINVVWKVSVNDTSVPGLYTSRQLRESLELSSRAAEEICPGNSTAPVLRRQLRLSLHQPSSDTRLLNDCLLLYSGGVELSDGVFVNGVQLGTVEDGSLLSDKLREFIKNQMPNAAVFGSISGKLSIRPVFSCEGHETNYEDMLLLVSGMAPVFYVDQQGKIA